LAPLYPNYNNRKEDFSKPSPDPQMAQIFAERFWDLRNPRNPRISSDHGSTFNSAVSKRGKISSFCFLHFHKGLQGRLNNTKITI
jgi:hypothetical protein